MSSAFNLSTLVAMRDQQVEQTSVHFWRCQLTREEPRFDWNPELRRSAERIKSDKDQGREQQEEEEECNDKDSSTRHVLQVTGCVLAPSATGVHLVTVRTRSYQPQQKQQSKKEPEPEPEPCPILCVDPAAQRTLALSHEFVLDAAAASSCAFELAEGSGPVWLTGTHRVHRVVQLPGADDEDDEESEVEEDEAEVAEDAEVDIGEESEEEEEEDDEEEEEELIEKAKPSRVARKGGRAQQPQKQQQQQKQKQPAAVIRKRTKPDS